MPDVSYGHICSDHICWRPRGEHDFFFNRSVKSHLVLVSEHLLYVPEVKLLCCHLNRHVFIADTCNTLADTVLIPWVSFCHFMVLMGVLVSFMNNADEAFLYNILTSVAASELMTLIMFRVYSIFVTSRCTTLNVLMLCTFLLSAPFRKSS